MKELGVKEAIEYLRRHFDDRFFDGRFDARSAQKKSIEALKKQIPKKLRIDDEHWLCCRNCDETFYLHNKFDKRNNFCGKCGQAIDWSDIDENNIGNTRHNTSSIF